VVTVATASGKVTPGHSKALALKLNGAGSALLKRFGRLRVRVTVTADGKQVASKVVTVTQAKAKTKKK